MTNPQNIYRCSCEERPRCNMYHNNCGNYADGSALVSAWDRKQPRRRAAEFTCIACWKFYVEAWSKPIAGFTNPDWWPKDEPWKPQITDMIEQARVQINERERREHEKRMRDLRANGWRG